MQLRFETHADGVKSSQSDQYLVLVIFRYSRCWLSSGTPGGSICVGDEVQYLAGIPPGVLTGSQHRARLSNPAPCLLWFSGRTLTVTTNYSICHNCLISTTDLRKHCAQNTAAIPCFSCSELIETKRRPRSHRRSCHRGSCHSP